MYACVIVYMYRSMSFGQWCERDLSHREYVAVPDWALGSELFTPFANFCSEALVGLS